MHALENFRPSEAADVKRLFRHTIQRQFASGVALIIALLMLGLCVPALAQEIRYFYDDLNRLIGVVDQQGNAAEYVYDAVGNILQIKRFTTDPNAAVSITLVSPNRGKVGTEVRIFGKGFSPTPGDNQVAFTGTAATVTASTSTSLTTSVPSGATTGPITLNTVLGSATSPEPFTVLLGLTLIPDHAEVVLGGSVGFQAEIGGMTTPDVTWAVNGLLGGNATLGLIMPTGRYTAPGSFPGTSTVTIRATSMADPTAMAEAPVLLVSQPAGLTAAPPVSLAPAPIVSSLLGAAPVSLMGGPVVSAVTPASGPVGATGLGMSLTGTTLTGATAIQFLWNGSVDGSLTATNLSATPDGTQVSFSLSISGTAPPGPWVVRVLTPQGSSTHFDLGANTFTVTP